MNEVLRLVAQLMELSARTAPKAAGRDFIVSKVIDQGPLLAELAKKIEEYGVKSGKKNFDRDGNNVANSGSVLLLGIKNAKNIGLDCGACGFPRCVDLPEPKDGPEFSGPWCAWRLIDLGIAVGSAVKTASLLNADNRIMYRIGVVAREMGLIDADVVLGIPLAATGKNIFFDR